MRRLFLALFAVAPAALSAQPPAAPPSTLTLSDAERKQLLDHNTEASVARAQSGIDGGPSIARGIHGEMGVMTGTHGTRGIYGGAAIPLGDNAGATVMFEDSRYGGRRCSQGRLCQ